MAIDTSQLNEDSDSPMAARVSLLEAVQQLNQLASIVRFPATGGVAPSLTLAETGDGLFHKNLSVGYGGAGNVAIEIGQARSADGHAYIDLHGVAGASDYESRFIRNSGVNGSLSLINTGTGDLVIQQKNAGAIKFQTNETDQFILKDTGVALFSGNANAFTNYLGPTGYVPRVQVNGITGATASVAVNKYSADTNAGIITLGKTRGATPTALTAVAINDYLGSVSFNGADGTRMAEGARIWAAVTGTVSGGTIPTSIYFSTANVGNSALTTHLAINHDGCIGFGTNTFSQGTGFSAIDSKVTIRQLANKTALMIVGSPSELYAGMKINVGPVTTGAGSVDYYDITTRPGGGGVGSVADRTMIRLESAISGDPSLRLQPNGGRAYFGPEPTTTAGLVTINTGGTSLTALMVGGMTTAHSNADVVISRSGAAEAGSAGRGASIQLKNSTNDSNILLQQYSNRLVLFNTSSGGWKERWHFTPGGSLMVGYADGNFLLPSGNFDDTIGVTLFGQDETQPGAAGCIVAVRNSPNPVLFLNNKNTGGLMVQMYNGGSQVGSISSNGVNTAYNTASDRRIKTGIKTLPDMGNLIDLLNPVEYEYKKLPGKKFYGWIAQELNEHLPQAVQAGDDGEEVEKLWQLDDNCVVPITVRELQAIRQRERERDAIIAQLVADVKALKEAA